MKNAFKGFFCALSLVVISNMVAMQSPEKENAQLSTSLRLQQQYNNLKKNASSVAVAAAQYSLALARQGWDKIPNFAKTQINTVIDKVLYTTEGRIAAIGLAAIALTIALYEVVGSTGKEQDLIKLIQTT